MSDIVLPDSAVPEGKQVRCLQDMVGWYKSYKSGNRTKQYFLLNGFAGTGKTFMMKFFLKELGLEPYDVVLCTFMGRSAQVLSRSAGFPACTIHSAIYRLAYIDGVEQWVLDPNADIKSAKLIIMDECSTVGKKMFLDLLYFKRPILVLGDPFQIGPVKDEALFQTLEPDFFLDEVRRQALDSPIIRLSMMIRNGEEVPNGNYMNGAGLIKAMKMPALELSESIWKTADTIIVGKNNTRNTINRWFRNVLGYTAPLPMKGEKIMCMKNNHDIKVMNGSIGTVTEDSFHDDRSPFAFRLSGIMEDGTEFKDVQCFKPTFVPTHEQAPAWMVKKYAQFDYGYAMTGHKAIGSQFNNVLLLDEWTREDRLNWLYTGVTRAVDNLLIGDYLN